MSGEAVACVSLREVSGRDLGLAPHHGVGWTSQLGSVLTSALGVIGAVSSTPAGVGMVLTAHLPVWNDEIQYEMTK